MSITPEQAARRAADGLAPQRDPARIDPIIDNLRRYWRANPDLRLGQIVVNAVNTRTDTGAVFYAEDDVIARHLDAPVASLPPEPAGPPVVPVVPVDVRGDLEKLANALDDAAYESGQQDMTEMPEFGAPERCAKERTNAIAALLIAIDRLAPAKPEPAADVLALVDAYGQAEREFSITLPVDFNGHRSAEQVADIAAARKARDAAKSALLRALGIGEG